jgi:perosamine synthetase
VQTPSDIPIRRIPLAQPIFDKEMEKAAIDALTNEKFVLGESVIKFEEEFAKYCGVDFAISTSSGTNALQFALIATGLSSGHRVVTSPASFIASANAIIHANGQPVFSDIDSESCTLDPKLLNTLRGIKPKAVIPVHLYGHPADMDSINSIAEKKGLFVIEDACQAHGATYKGRKTGSLGDIGCFSFYPSKNMTVAGDGGMVTTNDPKIAQAVSKLRDCGRKSQYIHDIIGYTSRLNSVNAAVGRVQLRRLDEWNEKRRNAASLYHRLLSGIDSLVLPPIGNTDGTKPVFHLYVIRTKLRDSLKAYLESNGISCGIHYALPIHLQPIYKKMYHFKSGLYPHSEELCKTCLSIPIYPGLSTDEVSFIADRIQDFFQKKGDR